MSCRCLIGCICYVNSRFNPTDALFIYKHVLIAECANQQLR
jgi:hypothetical protein